MTLHMVQYFLDIILGNEMFSFAHHSHRQHELKETSDVDVCSSKETLKTFI